MPNDDYIKRSDALKLICTVCQHFCDDSDEFGNGICSIFTSLEGYPAADVEPVRHAEWVFDPLAGDWICSDCDLHSMEHGRFCPTCGAKMDGVADNV